MCEAEGCEKERHFTKPYCRMHLARLKRTGTLGGYKEIYNYEKICITDDCDEKYTHNQSQLCDTHFEERRVGIRKTITERLLYYTDYADIDYDDLWRWVKKEMA